MDNDELYKHELRVHVAWTGEREAQAFRRLAASRDRRPRARAFGLALGAGGLAAVAVLAIGRAHGPAPIGRNVATSGETSPGNGGSVPTATARPRAEIRRAAPPSRPPDRRVRFRDGSTVLLTGLDTDLKLVSVEENRIVSELVTGMARFEIAKRPSRVFRVIAGDATIEVLGTMFELERRGARVGVRVIEGRVRVAWAGGERRLGVGDEGVFPPTGAPAASAAFAPTAALADAGKPAPAGDGERAKRAEQPEPPNRRLKKSQRPRMLVTNEENTGTSGTRASAPSPAVAVARANDDGRATAGAPKTGADAPRSQAPAPAPAAVDDKLASLLRVADEARAGGRSVDAASALRQAASQGGALDPRVPLAEFRLGRLLLEDLGQPREAAAVFARARAMAPRGPLASDALAREVEAWSAAGDRERARARAREYLAKYPTGNHAEWVRRWGADD